MVKSERAKLQESVGPVSYTHLDVYKRQDLRGAIGFSSFGVLLYYFIANLAALRQERGRRRYPPVLAVAGAIGCVGMIATLPLESVLAGLAVLAAGLVYRAVRTALSAGSRRQP